MTYGYLMHHGVKGMRWGVRNYQNADGSLTAEGRARYGIDKKNANYDKSNALGKRLHQNIDYRNARAQLNRDIIRSDLKAFKKGGGGLKTVIQNRKAGEKIISQINRGMDEKYGTNAGMKARDRYHAQNIASIVAASALTGMAIKAAYNKYGSSGKSYTNKFINDFKAGFNAGFNASYNASYNAAYNAAQRFRQHK